MKTINWNTMSELGLIERINREILHPLGLAVSRTPETGVSEIVLVAPDKEFKYPDGDEVSKILSSKEIHNYIDTKC